MTLIVKPGFNGMTDTDAIAYVNAVEAADGQLLEFGVGKAINDFVVGCKLDGTWSAIKASCILAGARTRTGALVPLVGAAPTSFNFVDANYNRKTGLVGNGSSRYINSGYTVPVGNLDNHHLSVNISSVSSGWLMGAIVGAPSAYLQMFNNSGSLGFTSFSASSNTASSLAAGFVGISRFSSSQVNARSNLTTTTNSQSRTDSGFALSQFVFARNENSTPGQFTSSPITFYSIGESLDLAKLNARVTDLINAFAAAIP